MSEAHAKFVSMKNGEYPEWPRVNVAAELSFLRTGGEPFWERPHKDGQDITDRPELWDEYQRQRRTEFEQRVAQYKADGLI